MSSATDVAERLAENPASALDEAMQGGDFVFLGVTDVNGSLRGKAMTAAEFEGVAERGYAPFTDLLVTLDPLDEPITDHKGIGVSAGAGDLLVMPDPETLAPMIWRPGWRLCLGDARWRDGERCGVLSRCVLRRALEALAELGLEAMAAIEYEVRLRRASDGAPAWGATSYSFGELGEVDRLIMELRVALDAMGVDMTTVHTEAGAGLLELNLAPRRGLRAADEATIVKAVVKDLARRQGYVASFLAKPDSGAEGSSGHVHLSLWDEGTNAFAAGIESDTMRHAIAGLVEYLPAASALYNPNINSYKRLVPGFFAPVNATWAVDNRSVAVRALPADGPNASRIELRRPGADANPYLALAAMVASVVLGLRRSLEPPAEAAGDASASIESGLPTSLESAIDSFAAGNELRDVLGERFAVYYEESRRWELRAWQRAVSDWERSRYEGAC